MQSNLDQMPPPFPEQSIETVAQQNLNRLVLTLFQRTEGIYTDQANRMGTLHVIDNPDQADVVFKTPKLFQKNFALVAALGASRFNLNGERWAQLRDRTQPAYNKASKPSGVTQIETLYREALDKGVLQDGSDLESALIRGALSVFCKAVNINLVPQKISDIFPHIRTHAKMLQFFSWYGVQYPDVLLRRTEWLEQRFHEVVLSDTRARDFAQQTVREQPESELSLAVTDLIQNLFAAIETTVATLSWAVQLLGQNAEVQEALRAEAAAPFTNRPLTRGFLWETMRCFPPIPFVIRELSADFSGYGLQFSKGDQVIISIIGLHRHQNFWDNPNEFHAARSEFLDRRAPPIAFRPFLSGPRVCGGKRLAELEMLVALPEILRRWRIVSNSTEITYDYSLALRPRSLEGVQLEKL